MIAELYRKFEVDAGATPATLSWGPASDGSGQCALHVIFKDVHGSLSTITSAITERGIAISRVVAFTTDSGVGIDTFTLSTFDQPAADVLKRRLHSLITGGRSLMRRGSPALCAHAGSDELSRHLTSDYVASTTVADRLVHLELYRRLKGGVGGGGGGKVFLTWMPTEGHATHKLLYLVFADRIGSLGAITAALRERGISILRAVAFCSDAGVGVTKLEVATFDRESAGVLTTRLKAEVGDNVDVPGSLPEGVGTITFVVGWRGTLGGRRGQSGELVVGASWLAIGQLTLEASALSFLQQDLQRKDTVHIGFTYKRKAHTLLLRFQGGREPCDRAYALLRQLLSLVEAAALAPYADRLAPAGVPASPNAASASTTSANAASIVHPSSVASFRRSAQDGRRAASHVTTFRDRARRWAAAFAPTPAEASKCGGHFCGVRLILLIIATLGALLLANDLLSRAHAAGQPYRRHFHPASCKLRSLMVHSETRIALKQDCRYEQAYGSGSPVHVCSRHFWVVYPAWHT